MGRQIYLIATYGWALVLALTGCGGKEIATTPDAIDPVRQAGLPKKMLALGDSYTIGQNVPAEDRFPHQTASILTNRGFNVSLPDYIARTGWTTGQLLEAINYEQPQNHYDLVTLLIGVNNQYQGRDTTEYARHLDLLVKRSIQLAINRNTRVFMVSIPDYSVVPFAAGLDKEKISREIDMFNGISARIAAAYGISYSKITPESRPAQWDRSLVAGDGLHPSGKEYRKWAELLAAKMELALK